jgi:hypothetical protein
MTSGEDSVPEGTELAVVKHPPWAQNPPQLVPSMDVTSTSSRPDRQLGELTYARSGRV